MNEGFVLFISSRNLKIFNFPSFIIFFAVQYAAIDRIVHTCTSVAELTFGPCDAMQSGKYHTPES